MSQKANDDLIYEKEKEWRDLLVSELKNLKLEKERLNNENDDIRDKFIKLQADFKHNLDLLTDRENDLREAEKENDIFQDSVCNYEEKISEMSVERERMSEALLRAEKMAKDMAEKVERIKERAEKEVQNVREEKIREVERERRDAGERIMGLERALAEITERAEEDKMERQSQEGLLREQDRKEREESHWKVVQHEMKYRLASKELEVCRAGKAEVAAQLAESEERLRLIELNLAEARLQSESEASIARMCREQEAAESRQREARLQAEVEKLVGKLRAREEAVRARTEVVGRLRAEVAAAVEAGHLREEELRAETGRLSGEMRRLEEALEERDGLLGAREAEVARLTARMAEEGANKSDDLRAARAEAESLRGQLRERQEELMAVRAELEYAVCRGADEDRRRKADEERLAARLEAVRADEMARVEGLVARLSRTRDEALAEARELRRTAGDRKEVRICTNCSQNTSDEQEKQDQFKTPIMKDNREEVRRLETQNEQLKEIISRMTEEATRDLHRTETTPAHPNQGSPSPNNKHIVVLADRNRQLQQEKIELLATSRKLQAKLEGIETDSRDTKKQVRERETELSQVRFELESLKRHSELDGRNLRRRVQELETELAGSRREAGEYYKGTLELGRAVEELQAEVTGLRAAGCEEVVGGKVARSIGDEGEQEELIRGLRAEVGRLRNRLAEEGGATEAGLLRGKLRQAARHIKALATERQVLIDVSNRLRAELKQLGVRVAPSVPRRAEVEKGPRPRVVEGRVGANRDEEGSSVGRRSAEEVFLLLEDEESIGGKSSGLELPSPASRAAGRAAKRNMVIDRR